MIASGTLIHQNWEAIEPTDCSGANLHAIHEQVDRILSDSLFHNSKRYSDLLRYIVDKTLEGEYESLKERIIGIEVFERSPDYDTTVDSIVRGAAAEVRKRLARYYEDSGHTHELRIEVPTRSYVADFKQPGQAVPEPPIVVEQPCPTELQILSEQTSTVLQRSVSKSKIWIAIALCFLVFAGWEVKHVFAPTRALDKFWEPMLNNPGMTLITVGSPAWLTSSPVAQDEVPASPESGTSLSQFITHQTNFPMADLSAASAITSFLARRGRDSVIRLSDSTTLSDLHGNPLIVLGSFPNEWALRLGANLPFQFRHDAGLQSIEDTNRPADHKWVVNMRSPYDQVTSEYALITRAVDQTTGQWWIGVGGVTVLGTIAAQQMLIDPKEMKTFIAQLPKDWDSKNIQIVLEIKMVKGSAGTSRVVATRTW